MSDSVPMPPPSNTPVVRGWVKARIEIRRGTVETFLQLIANAKNHDLPVVFYIDGQPVNFTEIVEADDELKLILSRGD